MSVSFYYTARRSRAIDPTEQAAIDSLIEEFTVDDKLEEYLRMGRGLNWESFCVYDPADPTEPGVIFEGATKLPDNTDDDAWAGLQHWIRLLSRIRRALPGAEWHVHVDDHVLVWDDDAPHVIQESQEIAEQFGRAHEARDRIQQCRARFEMAGGDDLAMEHFNDYLAVVEAAQRLGTIYAFDPASGEFI